MTTSIGFSGTRKGMTDRQSEAVNVLLEYLINHHNATEVHHGDCIGSDEQFHNMSAERLLKITIHPPNNSKFRAFCNSKNIEEELNYLERNRNIIKKSNILIATPDGGSLGTHKSGTWYTIEYAINENIPTIILFPDGSRTLENFSKGVNE